jgi:hypothetical protein
MHDFSTVGKKIWSLQEEFEDTKGVIRIHKSKKDRQYTDQEKKSKWTNNDLQNITHKTLDIVFGNKSVQNYIFYLVLTKMFIMIINL